jgi:hypothetical protein
MEAVYSCETLVPTYRTARYHNLKDHNMKPSILNLVVHKNFESGLLSRHRDGLRARRSRIRSLIPDRDNRLFFTVSRLTLGPTQLLIQWVLGNFSLGSSDPDVNMTNYLQLCLRIPGIYTYAPHTVLFN